MGGRGTRVDGVLVWAWLSVGEALVWAGLSVGEVLMRAGLSCEQSTGLGLNQTAVRRWIWLGTVVSYFTSLKLIFLTCKTES